MSEQDQVNKTDIDWIKNTLTDIKEQTTKTNGRVTVLESFRIQALTYGSIAIVVVPYLLNRFLE